MKSMASFIVNFEYVSKIFGSADYCQREKEIKPVLLNIRLARPNLFTYLNVLQYKRTNELIIKSFEFVANVIIASFANDVFHTRHQMVNQLWTSLKTKFN